MVQSDIKTHHLKHLGSLGSEMLQNNTKTNNLQPLNDTLRGLWRSRLFKRHLPQGLGLAKLFKRHPPRAFGPHTVRCANHPGRPRDETRFKQHPPNGIPTRRRGHSTATSPVVLRSVLRNCRGVPFKGPRSLGGSRLKGPSKNRGVQGGRGEGGKVNLPPYMCSIHADGSANISPQGTEARNPLLRAPRWVSPGFFPYMSA